MSGRHIRVWSAAMLFAVGVGVGVGACGVAAEPDPQAAAPAAAASAETFRRGDYVFPPQSLADWHEAGAEYKACMDKSGGVTEQMLDCSDAEIGRQDEASARAFAALSHPKVDPAARERFQAEEPGWKTVRSAFCRAATAREAGTATSLAYASCVLDITIDRRLDMEALLSERPRN